MLQDYNISILMIVGSWEMVNGKFTTNGGMITGYTWGMVWNFLRTWQDRGITLELCHDENHAMNRICELYSYYSKSIHTGAYLARSSSGDSRITALTACKGVGEKTATDLLNQFKSLKEIVLASQEQITSVSGIGPKTAKKIYDFLH
jgi:ERCC4-type nuclease